MNSHELRELFRKTERLTKRRRTKRFIYTALFYSAVLFATFHLIDRIRWSDFWDIIGVALVCMILSIPCVLFNSLIFGQLFRASQNEEKAIEFLKKQIEKKEREESRK